MADKNPAQALNIIQRIEMLGQFIENPAITKAVAQAVPVSMPREVGALGFDTPLWVGLGIVGLWSALDAYYERADLTATECATCHRRCIAERFANYCQDVQQKTLAELEDLRHLYAHNYAGEADEKYFDAKHPRHVLRRNGVILTCGAQFDGRRAQLTLHHLRVYSRTAKNVLERAASD
jgi:hypothetical protein